jgi:DNA uptake protein ComE-like DNA-binding protein
MYWHDFFYFSKGERRALILLLCLITIAGILLIMNEKPAQTEKSAVEKTESDAVTANQSSGALSPVPDSVAGHSSASSEKPSGRSAVSRNKPKYTTDRKTTVPEKKKETVPERVERIISYSRPSSYVRTEKFEKGTLVELNTADTTILKKVPGIGSVYAKRIVGYRNLLGGYYSVMQLSEVYGVDEERYNALASWFTADTSQIIKLPVNELSQDSLRRHPYINYNQAKIITQLRRQKGKITGWENLRLLDEFKEIDIIRLQYYLSFE